jgi:hypothetical protein
MLSWHQFNDSGKTVSQSFPEIGGKYKSCALPEKGTKKMRAKSNFGFNMRYFLITISLYE